jgi:hypothetical protein
MGGTCSPSRFGAEMKYRRCPVSATGVHGVPAVAVVVLYSNRLSHNTVSPPIVLLLLLSRGVRDIVVSYPQSVRSFIHSFIHRRPLCAVHISPRHGIIAVLTYNRQPLLPCPETLEDVPHSTLPARLKDPQSPPNRLFPLLLSLLPLDHLFVFVAFVAARSFINPHTVDSFAGGDRLVLAAI